MGFLRTACGIGCGLIAIEAIRAAGTAEDGDDFLNATIIAGFTGAGAYHLLKPEVKELIGEGKNSSCISYDEQRLLT